MKDAVIPYTLPEVANHSFFFISQRIAPKLEAQLHRHEAWELYYVVNGKGIRTTGDNVMPFSEGDTVLIPPSMPHQWDYNEDSADENGEVSYHMVAFSPDLIKHCTDVFPEIKAALYGRILPDEALKFKGESAQHIKEALIGMCRLDEIGRLGEMIKLLPFIFSTKEHSLIGRPVKIEKDIRRMQDVVAYVMAHYVHHITLDDIAEYIGMNRSAFCTFFKRNKGMTFSEFVTEYRLETACELLKTSKRQVSEICYAVGFNDLPHFNRVFKYRLGTTPTEYRRSSLD